MAEIIQFLTGWAAAEREFRKIVEESDLAPETAEWVHRDVWPRLKELAQSWRQVNFEGHEEANRTNKEVTADNLTLAIAQIVKLEIELYEARFRQIGRPLIRLASSIALRMVEGDGGKARPRANYARNCAYLALVISSTY